MNAFNVRENINPNVEFDEVFNEMIDCLSSYSTPTAMMDEAVRMHYEAEDNLTQNDFEKQQQAMIDEYNGRVRPERVAEESKERAERVKNDLDLRRELKEITGAEGYGTNTAYVRGTSQDGTTYEVRVGNHIANFENFDRNNEELP